MPRPANARLMKQLNRQAVLSAIRDRGPISRVELAALTGLSQPAVTAIVRDLLDLGLVEEKGLGQSSGGRPPIMLLFNPAARFVLAVCLEGERLWGGLADLSGALQVEAEGVLSPDPHDPARSVCDFLQGLIDRSGVEASRLAAVAVGVPGIAHTEGTVSHAPSLGWWQEVPLRDRLRQCFGVPVVVENDVNLMALGEYFQGAGVGVANLALMHVSEGIGAGILIDGNLFRGARNAAGEVGYLPLGPLSPRRPQDFGLFELHYSSRAIRQQLQAALPEAPGDDGRPVRRLRELAEAGLPWARSLFGDALRHWAHAVASITCILNPELVLLAGDAVDCGREGLSEVNRIVADLVPDPPEIRFAVLGSRAALTGAVAMALSLADENAYGIEADQ
ncbi:ROK family transcriptional regulator [Symbiobacterium thermophilum]|uniref:Transcriptional repressor n=1 Tax=Symbiobacterium thermophilum (strain DSM 24528 / JCM 14929 / IAM 14863 / T) TaxID=292459 RepID=Q67KQ9_SYMTH|nr:ROK family transcriptional regulator [Symbiobacterium thermophilum]BAD41738.1 transcriptional repressor [Symbiobacterium thermophilum IAM 14863]